MTELMLYPVGRLGARVAQVFEAAMAFSALCARTLYGSISPPFRGRDLIQQIHFAGWQSAPIVVICVCFAAAVTIVESSFHMKIVVQNDALVPGFAALLILRELGSVTAALLLASRVGAGIAAEVGTMQVTEQVDALRMLGIDPVRFIVAPRFVACVISGALLSIVANLACLYCAMLVSVAKLGYTAGGFITAMRAFVTMQDLVFACVKGAAFGAVIPLVACFFGFRCRAGAEGVGLATTQSVVASSVSIIGLDFALTFLFSYFY